MFPARAKRLSYPAPAADDQSSASERKAAMEVIRHAAERCHAEDMRTSEVYAALDRLNGCVTPNRSWAFRRFRRSLEIDDPINRSLSATLAYEAISNLIGL